LAYISLNSLGLLLYEIKFLKACSISLSVSALNLALYICPHFGLLIFIFCQFLKIISPSLSKSVATIMLLASLYNFFILLDICLCSFFDNFQLILFKFNSIGYLSKTSSISLLSPPNSIPNLFFFFSVLKLYLVLCLLGISISYI